MFYSSKNIPISLNSKYIFASDFELITASELNPIYLEGQRHSFDYIQNSAVNGSLKLNYLITGNDFLKSYLEDDESSYISGNIGGLYFSTGAIRSYSASIIPNAPIQVSVDILIFDPISGSFRTSQRNNPQAYPLNASDAIFTNFSSNVNAGNVISANYNYSAEINPVFYLQTGTGILYLSPERISFDKKQIIMDFTSDSSGMLLPLNGIDCSMRIEAADSGGSVLETFAVDGRMFRRTLNSNVNSPMTQRYEIVQNYLASTPTITSFTSPASVGTPFLIQGSNFKNILNVFVNNEKVDSFNVNSESQIQAYLSPEQNSGFIRIDSFADSAISSSKLNITYPSININSFLPNEIISGKSVLIQGDNFYKISKVVFNNVEAESFKIINSQLINAIAPGRTINGKLKVVSESRNISGTSLIDFNAFPVIDSFSPTSGIPNDSITLLGENLTGLSTVKINNINSTFTQTTPQSTLITVPVGNTWGYIKITNQAGQETTSKYGFTPNLLITGVSLKSGSALDTITISGVNFEDYMMYSLEGSSPYKVSFNGQITGFSRVNSRTLQGLVPVDGSTGPIRIFKPDGVSTYDSTGSFIYNPGISEITSFNPSAIISGDSLKSLIVGKNLTNISKVFFTGTGAALNSYITVWDSSYTVNSKPVDTNQAQYLITTKQNDILGLASSFTHTLTNPSSFSGNAMLTGLGIKTGVYDLYVVNRAGTGVFSGALNILPLVNLAQQSTTRIFLSSQYPSGDSSTYAPEKTVDNNTGTYCRTLTETGQWIRYKFPSVCQIFGIELNTSSTGYTLGTTGYLEVSLLTGSEIRTGIASSGLVNISPYTKLISGYGINTGTQSWRYEANSVLIRVNRRSESGDNLPYPLLLSDVKIYGIKTNRAE